MRYKVQDPQGNMREIEGPEGATDEEIIAQAKKLFAAETPAPTQEDPPPATTQKKMGLRDIATDMLDAAFTAAVPGRALPKFGELLEGAGYKTGGTVTDVAAKVLPPEAAAAAGFATNVGIQALPMALGGAAGKLAEPASQSAAKGLMQTALKPSTKSVMTGKAAQAIDTMLKEGINVSEGGLLKLQHQISRLNDEVTQIINNAPAGTAVDKYAAARELRSTLDKFSRTATPQSNLETIRTAWREFLNHPMLQGQSQIPVQLAQEIKQGTQSLVKKNYGEMKGAEIEAQKALARGLRKEIERVVPEVAGLNAKQSELLNTKLLLETRLVGEGNKDPGGLVWLANNPAQALGWLASRSAWVKSLLARGLYKGAPVTGQAAGAVYGSNVVGAEE